nr:putative atp-dependent helicase c17a2.12 [Quercus suber]
MACTVGRRTPLSRPPTSPKSIVSPLKAPEQLTSDALEFLDNLNHYIPLGCFSFKCPVYGGSVDGASVDGEGHHSEEDILRSLGELLRSQGIDTGLDALLSGIHRLASAHWIRVERKNAESYHSLMIYRLYLLPADVGLRYVDRNGFQSKKLYAALETLLPAINTDPDIWSGKMKISASRKFDMWATAEDGSLYHIFNTLKSPAPSVIDIPRDQRYSREALEDLLEPTSTPGLRTILMPYQRRSAGLMLQREAAPKLELDPRLEERIAPDGSIFYYNPRDLLFLRYPVYLEASRGGILAETMGLGKTVMILALILATKHHPPILPEGHIALDTRRSTGAATLSQMVTAAINRKSVPWQVELERVRHATGNDMANIATELDAAVVRYEIMTAPARWNRTTMLPAPKKLTLAATTIIVVPQNLCKQWKLEIEKHVEVGSLQVLMIETKHDVLPPPDELRTYDVVLFSRNRFDSEARDGQDILGRTENQRICRCPYIGATRTRDCTCVRSSDLYDSPLKHLHFKRLIVDEGHFFANSGSNTGLVANKLVTVDHRWIVSGTPAKNLIGVEVVMSTEKSRSRDVSLPPRRDFGKEDRDGAIKSIASLAQHFLRVKPWASASDGSRVEWDEHMFRHETVRGRSYSGFSSCLRHTLESVVIKTQIQDVERDLILPPLSHKVIHLEPSFIDKVTANIFTSMLIANAVASERTDADYLFHKNSAKARHQLVSNLRQSAFFWTGFSETDVLAMIKNSETYLQKSDAQCSIADRKLLLNAMQFGHILLAEEGWKTMTKSHELGIFVQGWPEEHAEHWAYESYASNLMTGISPLLEAQRHVNCRTTLSDPGDGLAGAGIRALTEESASKVERLVKGSSTRMNSNTSSRRRMSKKRRACQTVDPSESPVLEPSRSDQPVERSFSSLPDLPYSSPYLRTKIIGTASAKLSYLITQVLKFYSDEKIIIFYDGKNVAFYIAQMLELLHVKHEIYDSSLPAKLKSEYVVRFDQEPQDRVLLMDVKQAAFGLNLSSASRIFFVNPVCRPDVEAQAIKRAHRFGQTREVHVETLVLKDTIEEKILERSQRMTQAEHADASNLDDDGGIREIIQSARLLPLDSNEPRMARLDEPQQLWGRDGWRNFILAADVTVPTAMPAATAASDDVATARSSETNQALGTAPDLLQPVRPTQVDEDSNKKRRKKAVCMVDETDHNAAERYVEEDSPRCERPQKRTQVTFDISGSSVTSERTEDTISDQPWKRFG